ncbi:hypothetical protein [Subtercola lobariae]|uniref:Uncharacterized protein n=1 Tax=Subtercola lobariae TaxID=1588641 RepID=A0A917EW34_9MICO|nr:hypothetical protein [Subtercola lobariae]GGF14603.1 hypothetical protein GCM10011399_05570 [Subtercola lobariae]
MVQEVQKNVGESVEREPRASGFTRRSALKGAAWSVPVVALAVGTPAASASGTAPLTFDFVAALLQLHTSDTLAVLIKITNSGTEAVTDTASITLMGVPDDEVSVAYDPTKTQYVAPPESNTTNTTVDNAAFILAPHTPGGSYLLTSAGPVTVNPGAPLYIFFTVTWPTHNHRERLFVITGSFTFGTRTITDAADDVEIDFVDA